MYQQWLKDDRIESGLQDDNMRVVKGQLELERKLTAALQRQNDDLDQRLTFHMNETAKLRIKVDDLSSRLRAYMDESHEEHAKAEKLASENEELKAKVAYWKDLSENWKDPKHESSELWLQQPSKDEELETAKVETTTYSDVGDQYGQRGTGGAQGGKRKIPLWSTPMAQQQKKAICLAACCTCIQLPREGDGSKRRRVCKKGCCKCARNQGAVKNLLSGGRSVGFDDE